MDLITTHSNADFDALASMVAAKKLYPAALLVFPGSQERSVREFMSLCGGTVKIESEKGVDLTGVDRLIIVETRFKSRLGKMASLVEKKGVGVHIYDHHPRTREDIKADVDVFRKVGATVTILVKLIKKRGIGVTPLEATIMALGIYEDTGSLTFPSTTKDDVDMVSFLLSKGASLNVISSYLHRELSKEELAMFTTLLKSTETHLVHGVNVAISSTTSDKYVMDLSLLAHKLLEVGDYNVGFVMVKIDGKIQMVARSRLPYVDAGRVAKAFGGGGHTFAGSAIVRGMGLSEARLKLLTLLKKYIRPNIYAKDVMNFPVKTVSSNQKVDEVKKMMLKLSLDGVPVVDRGKLVGIVTLGDLEKAIHHGFGHSRVKGYMSINLITVTSQTPVYKIQQIMSENNIGRVPVMRNKRLIGMVTRSDLLKVLHADLIKGPEERAAVPESPKVSDVKSKIDANLPKQIVNLLKFVGRVADETGFNAFVVGGFVRDLLLGVKNYDVDIVVEKIPTKKGDKDAIAFSKIFAKRVHGERVIHKKFGTATVFMPWPKGLPKTDGMFKVDFATARIEYYEYPAALPTVTYSSIRQDLFRRDFTINAMAVRLNKANFGQLIDFFGGRRDLKAKKIRILHNLSFVEDPTRIFRAVRFAERYNFKVDEHTEHLIKTAVSLDMFERTEKQRLREELVLLLKEEKPLKAVARMDELHELRFIYPKIRLNKRLEKLFKSVEEAHSWYKLSYFKKRAVDLWLVYLMALLDDLNFEETQEICNKFVFTKGEAKRILCVKEQGPGIMRILSRRGDVKPSTIFKILEPISFEVILFLLAKARTVRSRRRISAFFSEYNGQRLLITGRDLRSAGLKPGPHFKRILTKTLYAKIDGKLKSKQEELAYARKIAKVT